MDRIHSEIRKIVVGNDLKTGMVYYVGMEMSGMKVSRIEEDDYDNFFLNLKSYIIFVIKNGEEFIWKKFERMSLTVEYKI